MAWDVKNRTEFTDIHGLDWRIDIEDETASSGDPVNMQATDTPLSFNFLAGSNKLFDSPIHGSTVDINVYAETNFQWAKLYAYGQQKYRVSIYYNTTTLYWRGFINSEGYQEPYDGVAYPVIITASDGLGQLKEMAYKYKTVTEDDTYYTGRQFESQIIIDILSKIQVTGFTEYCNLYEVTMNSTVTDSPFDQAKIDVDLFKDMNCYDVLKAILAKYDAIIHQVAGVMVIYRPLELSQALVKGRVFTTALCGGVAAADLVPEQFLDRTTAASDIQDVEGGNLIIQTPAKKVTINQNYGYKESWLDNYKFKADTFTGSTGGFDCEDWTTGTGIAPIGNYIPDEIDGISIHASETPTANYIYQTFGTNSVSTSGTFNFSFDYLLNNVGSLSYNGTIIHVKVKADDGSYYLHEVDENYLDWVAYETNIGITGTFPNGNSGWQSYKRTTDSLPLGGSYTITVWGLLVDDLYPMQTMIKNIRFYTNSDEIVVKRTKPSPFMVFWLGRLQAEKRELFKHPPTKEVKDIVEIVETEYIKTNDLKGEDLEYTYILGDVVDVGIDNVLEQFEGALSVTARDTLADAATAFDTDHSADYSTGGVTVTHSGNDIIFTATVAGTDFTGSTTITNTDGNLGGSVVNTTANAAGTPQIDTITIGGTGGTADITCNELVRGITYSSSLTQSATDFVTAYDEDYLAVNVVITSDGAVITFTENTGLGGFTGNTSIVMTSGDLSGLTDTTQEATEPTARVDTITLTGADGTANILCDGVTEEVAITETTTYSTEWHTEPDGTEDTLLLNIIKDEIAKQYSRPKQYLSIPIIEKSNVTANPQINITGNFKDVLNIDDSRLDIKTVSGWTLTNCTLAMASGYARYTTTDTDSYIKKTGLTVVGSTDYILSIRYRVVDGSPTSGQIFYGTASHGRGESYRKALALINDGEWHTVLLDMSNLTSGGTDWVDNVITDVWVDLTDQNPVIIDLDHIGFSRIYVFNSGTFNVRDREWQLDLIELIS